MYIGIDFDGTIVKCNYPDVGKFKFLAIPTIKWLKNKGYTLILWTCREGKYLKNALEACRSVGIEFDFINENSPARIKQYNGDCRKLSCDFLLDDMANFVFWPFVIPRILFRQFFNKIKKR